jgi:hypothetical protein
MEVSLNFKRETVAGFVDRGGNFRVDGVRKSFLAERWVSEYFNVRLDCIRKDEAQDVQESDQGNSDGE